MLRPCNVPSASSTQRPDGEPAGGVRRPRLAAPPPVRVQCDARADFDGAGVQFRANEVSLFSRIAAKFKSRSGNRSLARNVQDIDKIARAPHLTSSGELFFDPPASRFIITRPKPTTTLLSRSRLRLRICARRHTAEPIRSSSLRRRRSIAFAIDWYIFSCAPSSTHKHGPHSGTHSPVSSGPAHG
jgi:hypothetical protein